jgi:hypothetical protein
MNATDASNEQATQRANAWVERATELAQWSFDHLVNTTTHWGEYLPLGERVRMQNGRTDNARTRYGELTTAHLERHFKGEDVGDVLGLHAVSDGQSRWLAIDVDRHKEDDDADANFAAMVGWYDEAKQLGFSPLLEDSDGNGGFHLWILFDGPVPTERVVAFGRWLTRDTRLKKVELFPAGTSAKLGPWVRTPGPHHTRPHHSRIWSGSDWLEGWDAVEAILGTSGSPSSLIPAAAGEARKQAPKGQGPKDSRNEGFDAITGRDRELERVREALTHLDADDYDPWVRVGLCLRELGDDGLAVWVAWSRTSAKFREGVCESKWASFSDKGGVTLGTLFHMAKENGWPGTRGVRPEIVISTELDQVVEKAVQALSKDPDVYQRGGRLTSVRRDLPEIQGFERPQNSPVIVDTPKPVVTLLLAKNAAWMKTSKDDELVPAIPPKWAVEGIHALGEWPGIRPIKAVVESPTLRPDGTVLDRAGWDPATELLYEPSTFFPTLPAAPTREDARRAAVDLLRVVCDFPFAGDAHRAAWLSAILTPLARYAIDGPCPLFLFDANTAGSGKSKLADIIATVVTGRAMSRCSYPESDEEMRKRITAVALAGDRLMLIDNVATAFGGPALDAALTSTTWSDRILGRSEMAAGLPLNVTFFATGNNVELKGDSVRRIIPARLVSPEERPEERTGFAIEGDLLAYVRRERVRLVTAALTLLCAHARAGRPKGGLAPYGSFEPWSDVVRSAIFWATDVDPCETREGLRNSDPEVAARTALITGWSELPGGFRGLTASEAIDLLKAEENLEFSRAASEAASYATLRNTLLEWERNGKLPSPKSLGKKLKGMKDRVVNGMVIRGATNRTGSQVWRVEHAHAATPVSGFSQN